jgi:uncharacterized protein
MSEGKAKLTSSLFELGRVPRDVAHKMRYYVYLLVDPRRNSVFYVGKGKGNRVLAHLKENKDAERRKAKIIKDIRHDGQEPRIEILAHGLKDEATALRIEAAAIDLLGISNLTNEMRGSGNGRVARMSLREVVATYQKKPCKITDHVILIRINELYRHGLSDRELYDITRGAWKVDRQRAENADYAFAVYQGVVREVYVVNLWVDAGEGFSIQNPYGVVIDGRSEFIGTLAGDDVRRKYRDKYVGDRLPTGAQNPIAYVNV